MYRLSSSVNISIVITIALAVFGSGSVFAEPESEADPLTRQAMSLFKDGKLQDAADLEDKAIKQKPKDWLPHAAMSFFYWQQGNVPDAVTEGQKCVRYA